MTVRIPQADKFPRRVTAFYPHELVNIVGVTYIGRTKFYLTDQGDLINPVDCTAIPFDGCTPLEERNREPISAYLDSRDAAGM